MKNQKLKYKNFFLDGIMFLLPIVLILFLLKFLLGIINEIITPITYLLPQDSLFGIGATNIIALVILFLLVVVCGVLSHSRMGSIITDRLEGLVSKVVPGFSIIKNLFYEQKDVYDDKKIKPALAKIDDAWLFAFILEEKNDAGFVTVFVPSSPVPTSGNVYLMEEVQLKRLDISVRDTVRCITQLGIGSSKILEGKIPK